jgi:hypothetical protein
MAKDPKRSPRPPVVSIVVLIFLLQVVTFVALLWLQLAGLGVTRLETMTGAVLAAWQATDRWIDVALLAVLALLTVVSVFITIGLARMRRWAWLWGMTIQGARLLIGLIAYFRGDPYTFAMLVQLVAVLLLDQEPVRRAFGQEGGPRA